MIKATLKTTNKEFICVDFTFAVLSIKLTKSSLLENDAKNVDTNRCNTTPILQCKVLSITFLPNTIQHLIVQRQHWKHRDNV